MGLKGLIDIVLTSPGLFHLSHLVAVLLFLVYYETGILALMVLATLVQGKHKLCDWTSYSFLLFSTREKEYLGILKRANWILFQTERTMKEKEFGV